MLYRNTLLMFSKRLRMRDIDAHGNTLCEMCRTLHIGGHMMQGSGVNPTDAIAMLMQTVILPPLFFCGSSDTAHCVVNFGAVHSGPARKRQPSLLADFMDDFDQDPDDATMLDEHGRPVTGRPMRPGVVPGVLVLGISGGFSLSMCMIVVAHDAP